MAYARCQPVNSAQTHFEPRAIALDLPGGQSAAMACFLPRERLKAVVDMDSLPSRILYLSLTRGCVCFHGYCIMCKTLYQAFRLWHVEG